MSKKNQILITTLCFLAFFTIWELYSHSFDSLLLVLPAPSKVFLALWKAPHLYLTNSLRTLEEILWSLGIAFTISFPLAWFLYRYNTARQTLQPFFIFIQCMPMFAIAPIMILWLHWSQLAIIIPTVLMIFLPLTLNLYQGFKTTPETLLEFFRANQANSWQMFWKLRLPAARHHIFAGLRIGAAIAGISAAAGEWAGGQLGLGVLMHEARYNTDLNTVFAAFLCLTTMSLCLYFLIDLIEKFFLSNAWKRLFVIVGMLGVLSSCSPTTPPETRLLLDWYPNPNHVPLYVGVGKGFFSEQGIRLELLKLRESADSIPLLSTGETHIALYYMPHAILAASHGAKFAILGPYMSKTLEVLMFRNDCNISSLNDFEGKTIAYSYEGIQSTYLRSIFRDADVYPKEIKKVSFDLTLALANSYIDSCVGVYWNIEGVHLRHLGIDVNWIQLGELGIPQFHELVVIAHPKYIQENKTFPARFQQALVKSITYCQQNPEEAFAIYAKANPSKSEETLAWETKAWNLTYPLFSTNLDPNTECWDTFSRWMLKEGIISSLPHLDILTTNP